MKTYYVSELQDRNSYREAKKIKARNLQEAEAQADAMKAICGADAMQQATCGTVLKISDSVNDDGFIIDPPLAIKEDGEDWEEFV